MEAWRGVRLEARPQEACPQEGCPLEACPLEGCPLEAEALILPDHQLEECPLEACPPGGVSSWRLVRWRDDCQPAMKRERRGQWKNTKQTNTKFKS